MPMPFVPVETTSAPLATTRPAPPRVDIVTVTDTPSSPTRAWASSGFVPEALSIEVQDRDGARVADEHRRSAPLAHPALEPLRDHLDDPAVTDVFVNGTSGLWVDRGRGAERDALWRAGEDEVRALATALIAAGGRHLDQASPAVDVRLPGIRVHAVLPPLSAGGTLLSVRVARTAGVRLAGLRATGMFSVAAMQRMRELVAQRANLLITGAAGSGKTTLLAALLSEAPPSERIVTIEDVAELRPDHPHHVSLEARQANLEGVGGIDLPRLVREALRMRPDRLVLGECRGAEVRELLSALNTGHDGGAGTLHANGIDDVPARLEALGSLAGLDDSALARQAVSAIDVVLHVERDAAGTRRLACGGALAMEAGRLVVREDVAWRS